jgi:tRNA dimethylallyltransferase
MTKTQHDLLTRSIPPRYDATRIYLSFKDRADLYQRINRRVDIMMQNGLYDEVKNLLGMGLKPGCTAMQAIGYKEIAQAITEGTSIDDAVEKIKLESRRYAKRQLSWFRRDTGGKWLLWDKTPDYDYGLHILTDYLIQEGYNISVSK